MLQSKCTQKDKAQRDHVAVYMYRQGKQKKGACCNPGVPTMGTLKSTETSIMLLLPTQAGLWGIMKKVYRAPLYRTRWEHRAFTVTVTKQHAHNALDGGIGTAVKKTV